jgi:hypothetical protein
LDRFWSDGSGVTTTTTTTTTTTKDYTMTDQTDTRTDDPHPHEYLPPGARAHLIIVFPIAAVQCSHHDDGHECDGRPIAMMTNGYEAVFGCVEHAHDLPDPYEIGEVCEKGGCRAAVTDVAVLADAAGRIGITESCRRHAAPFIAEQERADLAEQASLN